MKLNNQQVKALASSFYNEIKEKIAEEKIIERVKQLQKFKPLYEKGIKVLENNSFIRNIEVCLTKDKVCNLHREDSFESWVDNYSFNQLVKNKEKYVSLSSIEEDIILATIESSSIEEIKKILKNKYK